MAINQISNVIYEENPSDKVVLGEYEEMALGQRKTYSAASLPKDASPEYCARIIKRILSIYKPEWSPTDLRDCLTPDLATSLGLWPLIKHLPCPDELNPKKDLYFVAWVLYPETRNVNEIDLVASVYQDIIHGTRQKFPKGYFYGKKGTLRAKAVFKLFMNEFVIPRFDLSCLRDAYELFATNEIDGLIEKCHLTAFVRDRFGLPLNFLIQTIGIVDFKQRALMVLIHDKHGDQRIEEEKHREAIQHDRGKVPFKMLPDRRIERNGEQNLKVYNQEKPFLYPVQVTDRKRYQQRPEIGEPVVNEQNAIAHHHNGGDIG